MQSFVHRSEEWPFPPAPSGQAGQRLAGRRQARHGRMAVPRGKSKSAGWPRRISALVPTGVGTAGTRRSRGASGPDTVLLSFAAASGSGETFLFSLPFTRPPMSHPQKTVRASLTWRSGRHRVLLPRKKGSGLRRNPSPAHMFSRSCGSMCPL